MTDAVRQALEWYAAEAEALAKNTATGAHTQAVLASVTVLALDGGRKARAALSEQPATHPAPVERVALTDKLIDAATIRHWGRRSAPALADHRGYARAVIAEYERANGIGTSAAVCRASQVGPDKWVCDCGGPPCIPFGIGKGEQA